MHFGRVLYTIKKVRRQDYKDFIQRRFRIGRNRNDSVTPFKYNQDKVVENSVTSSNLSKLLNIRNESRLLQNYPLFKDIPIESLEQRLSYLVEKNVAKARVSKMCWLLLLSSEDLQEQTEYLSKVLNLDFNCTVCFLKQPEEFWLNRVTHLWLTEQKVEEEFTRRESPYRNRVDFMAERLECEPWKIGDLIVLKHHIAVMPFHKIKYLLKLVIDEAAVPRSAIFRFPCVFDFNMPILEQRVRAFKKHNIRQGNLMWTLMTSDDNFQAVIAQHNQHQLHLSTHEPLVDYLRTQLQCQPSQADKIVLHLNEYEVKQDPSKLNAMLQFLLSMGFDLSDIRQMPFILWQNEQIVNERWDNLIKINIPADKLKEFFINVSRSTDGRPMPLNSKVLESIENILNDDNDNCDERF